MTLADLSVLQVLVLLLPIGIPFLVDLVTKATAPAALKSAVALFLSLLLGAVQAAVVAPNERWQDYLAGILYSAVIAFVTHYTGATAAVERKTARFGIAGPRSARQRPHRTSRTTIGTATITIVPDISQFAASLERAAAALRALDTTPPED